MIRTDRARCYQSLLLILPLWLFVLLVFVVPIAALLRHSIDNPEVAGSLPRTVKAIEHWGGQGLPSEAVFHALATDLPVARDEQVLGLVGQRLNRELPGFLSLLNKTARQLPLASIPHSYQDALIAIDARWREPGYWHAIQRNIATTTPYYWLTALDHRIDDQGRLAAVAPDQAIYLTIFARTFWMGLVVMVICLLLAYPLAYWLAILPARRSNLLMIMVLLPFWTSVLVRITAWMVLLQSGGLINMALLWMGVIDHPLPLVFNRIGVYIAMVHILLPFMILPIYSVMKGIPPTDMKAAISLGAHPFTSFWRVYFPQTIPGVVAGGLLVFIQSIGYYITPALLGNPDDQMVSYFIAFYTNTSLNWGLATALGGLLLIATLLLYLVYNWLGGANRMRFG